MAELQKARQLTPKVLVAYSGGKDSMVVMDLAVRVFDHVEGFFMYLVEGLDCVEHQLDEARRRWGVRITQYPHWVAARLIRGGVYCNPSYLQDTLPEWKLNDVYALAMQETDIPVILTGAKRADSAWRRRFMTTARQDAIVNPIAAWHKYDVLGYLKARDLPLPPSSGQSATGIDLSPQSLLWLHDTYPEDFARLAEVFIYAPAVVWRRQFYGA